MSTTRRNLLKGVSTFVVATASGGAAVAHGGLLPIMNPEKVTLQISHVKRTIRIRETNVSAQTVYSKLKMLWAKTDLIRYPFPMRALTPVLFEMLDDWRIVNPEVINFDHAQMERGLLYNEI